MIEVDQRVVIFLGNGIAVPKFCFPWLTCLSVTLGNLENNLSFDLLPLDFIVGVAVHIYRLIVLTGLIHFFGLIVKAHLSRSFLKKPHAQKEEKEILDSHCPCFLFSMAKQLNHNDAWQALLFSHANKFIRCVNVNIFAENKKTDNQNSLTGK